MSKLVSTRRKPCTTYPHNVVKRASFVEETKN